VGAAEPDAQGVEMRLLDPRKSMRRRRIKQVIPPRGKNQQRERGGKGFHSSVAWASRPRESRHWAPARRPRHEYLRRRFVFLAVGRDLFFTDGPEKVRWSCSHAFIFRSNIFETIFFTSPKFLPPARGIIIHASTSACRMNPSAGSGRRFSKNDCGEGFLI